MTHFGKGWRLARVNNPAPTALRQSRPSLFFSHFVDRWLLEPGFRTVEGEAQSEAQAFRSERKGACTPEQIASNGAIRGVPAGANGVPSNKNDFATLRFCASAGSGLTPRPTQVVQVTAESRFECKIRNER
jgi:hypothetical protein